MRWRLIGSLRSWNGLYSLTADAWMFRNEQKHHQSGHLPGSNTSRLSQDTPHQLEIETLRTQYGLWTSRLKNWPCAFWISCCPRHLNDDGASCVSSQGADGSSPPPRPRLAGHTWSCLEGYGNLRKRKAVETDTNQKTINRKIKHSQACEHRRILLFGLHLILQSQLGTALQVLLVSLEVIFSVFPT